MTGRREAGYVYQSGKHLAVHGFALVCPNGPAGAKEMLDLHLGEGGFSLNRQALLGVHGANGQGPVRADRHTMATIDAQIRGIACGCGNRVSVFEPNDPHWALGNARPIAPAFFLIYGE